MREEQIFHEVLEQAAEKRAAFLAAACGADVELRQRVEVLLQAQANPGSFLQFPAPGIGNLPTIDQPPVERPGTQIGPYKLLQQIGEGGMGTVYMAEQTHPMQRKVALKVIKAGMDSSQVIARFEAERQALAMMDHVNIARVLDAGCVGVAPSGGASSGDADSRLKPGLQQPGLQQGRPYFVMELVHGVPITRYCDDNHLTPRQRLELFVPVCQAIQHAHQKGIIHRDIKPSNVMVTLYDGKPVPKVIDFGVAKATEQKLTERTLFTQYGTMVGTLEYMSPEQAEMSALGIDTRSDIYSLGVLLYELLTGNTPLTHKRMKEAAYAEVLRMIKEEEPPKPSTRLSDSGEALASISANRHTEPAKLTKLVRGELDWIVMKTLEKDRNRRYETANGFAQDLERYLNDETVQACPPSAGYRLRKFARRNKGPVLAVSLVLAALMIGIVGTTWGMIRATHAEADAVREAGEKTVALGEKETALATAKANELEARKQGTLAKENAKTAKEQELLARRRFYAAQTNLAQQAWEAGQPARTLELLESQRPKLDQEDLRGFDWYYLWRICHRNLHRTLSGPKGEDVYALAITPDGKTLVSGSTDASVRVWDVATGKERAVLGGHKSSIWRLAISPDGKMVASATSGSMDQTVKLWDLATSELLATLTGDANRLYGVRSVAFSPDGKTLAAGTGDGTLEFWDVRARKLHLTLPAHSDATIALAYSPDGKMLASASGWDTSRGPGGLKVWDVTSERPRMIVFQAAHCIFVAFSPDSKLLAASTYGGAKVWSVPAGELKATFDSPDCLVQSVAFSADGNTLVLGGNDRIVKLWEFATGATRAVGVHRGAVNAVAFFPQGDLLASGSTDGTVKVWHASPPQDSTTFARKSAIRSMAFTPDSKLLVVGSDSATTVLDAVTGMETATLPVGGVLAVSADANLLAASAPDDKRVIWDVAAARARALLPVGPKLSGAAFSRDGQSLVTWIWDSDAPELAVRLWDLATSRVRLTLKNNLICATFSPDGRTLASGEQFGAVTLWDATTGQQRMTLQPFEGANCGAGAAAFSNDGKMLAVGNSEGRLRLWNVETGQLLVSFKGHTLSIKSVAFSPDDKTLLSGSVDRTARLWDVVTGQEVLTLKDHKSTVHLVAFAPDGKRLATASHNEVKLWLAATEPEATAFRVELDPDDADSPRAMNNWGDRLQKTHRTHEAEKAYRNALARLEKLAAALPDISLYRQELAYSSFTDFVLPSSTDRTQSAEQAHRRVREVHEKLPPDQQYTLALRYHRLSRRLTTGPDPKLANPSLALDLAKQAVELSPNEGTFWCTLGLAHYRAGDWKAAIAALEKSIELRNGGESFDWFFLAMAHWQLDEKDKAREWYDRAVEWMGKNQPTNEVLRRFRAEAEELLRPMECGDLSPL